MSLATSSSEHQCLPIQRSKQSLKYGMLSLNNINKAQLVNPDIMISKYKHLYQERDKISNLAQKLAQKSYFGDDVLVRCTVLGTSRYPALPVSVLNDIKAKLFQLLPEFWMDPEEYEKTWSECSNAIGQRCRRLRQ